MKAEHRAQTEGVAPRIPTVLFGLGRIGQKHLQAMRRLPFDVRAIVDPALAGTELAGDIPIYKDAMSLLRAEGPVLFAPSELRRAELVYGTEVETLLSAISGLARRPAARAPLFVFATPPGGHLEETLRALLSGAHVLVEKPVAMNEVELRHCETLTHFAEQAGLVTSVGHVYRYLPPFSALLPDLRGGKFGRPLWAELSIHWGHDSEYYRAPWRGTIAADGGAILNQSIHGIDLASAVLMADDTVEISSVQRNFVHEIEAEDYATAHYDFANGSVLTVTGTTATWSTRQRATLFVKYEELEIWAAFGGTLPQLSLRDRRGRDWRWHYLRESLKQRELGVLELLSAFKNPHELIYRDLYRGIVDGQKTLTDLRTGAQAVSLALAMARRGPESRESSLES